MEYLLQLSNQIQNEIDEIEQQIDELEQPRKPYTVQPRLNPMQDYTDEQFRKRFRLNKAVVIYLYSFIGQSLEPVTTRPNFTLSGTDKILITLRYLATASFQLVAADFYGVSESTVCRIIPIVFKKIASLRERFIRMPATDEELEEKKREFFRVAGMPATIGTLDGTLVKIQKVGGAQNKTDFFCRKQFYGVNVQIVCDANANVEDIVARWPGSTHDEIVLLNSSIFERFLYGEFRRDDREAILLGDGGYGGENFLAVPIRNTNRQLTRAERMYQTAHIATRNVVERFNGQWKQRFPCLWIGMSFRKLETILDAIVATAVLHNICKMFGDNEPPPLSPQEQLAYEAALQTENDITLDMQQQRQAGRQGNQPHGTIQNEMLRNYFEQQAQ